jgi:serine protease Do
MISSANPNGSTSIHLEGELARVHEQLRRITVEVRSGSGSGSGVIWRPDGVIVTNAHVAIGPRHSVVLADGRTLEARLVARDRRRDLVSLQVAVAGLVAANVRDPSSLRTGELVVAMGNPMGVTGALATGILHSSPSTGWVQADIRLAPGNSGGPLADAQGKVIGINSMVMNGLALAVPSTAVHSFVTGEERPRLGVTLQPVRTATLGKTSVGLMVVDVEPNGPAHLSGMMVGDILMAAEGMRFSGVDDLAEAIAAALPSGALHLELLRAGALKRCRVKMDCKIGVV